MLLLFLHFFYPESGEKNENELSSQTTSQNLRKINLNAELMTASEELIGGDRISRKSTLIRSAITTRTDILCTKSVGVGPPESVVVFFFSALQASL